MSEKIRSKTEGKENVFDVIDDAAQVLFKMPEGIYRDELDNIITVVRSGKTTLMVLGDEDFKFTVECIEDEYHTGKITSISIQNKDKKTSLYAARGVVMTYDRGILGERGRLMMHRLIKKLQTCTPEQQQDIHGEIRRDVLEAIGQLQASLLHPNVESAYL